MISISWNDPLHTVWKIQDFFDILILREINLGKSRSFKNNRFCNFGGYENDQFVISALKNSKIS